MLIRNVDVWNLPAQLRAHFQNGTGTVRSWMTAGEICDTVTLWAKMLKEHPIDYDNKATRRPKNPLLLPVDPHRQLG